MRRLATAVVLAGTVLATGALAYTATYEHTITGHAMADPCAPRGGQLFNQCATLDMSHIDDSRDDILAVLPAWAPERGIDGGTPTAIYADDVFYSDGSVIFPDPVTGVLYYDYAA